MANLKLNKPQESEFDVIPDSPEMESEEHVSYVKKEETEERKLFSNKKANLALKIAVGVLAFLILAAVVFVYVI